MTIPFKLLFWKKLTTKKKGNHVKKMITWKHLIDAAKMKKKVVMNIIKIVFFAQ